MGGLTEYNAENDLQMAIEQAEDLVAGTSAVNYIMEKSLSSNTMSSYVAQFAKFKTFLATYYPDIDCTHPGSNFPTVICNFIAIECSKEEVTIGSKKIKGKGLGMSKADLIRSSVSYHFTVKQNRSQPWDGNGNAVNSFGNPTLSMVVSRFMQGLRKLKVHGGERSESVRALTSATLKIMYDKMLEKEGQSGRRELKMRMTYFAILVGFLCLMRSDEVAQIDMRHLHLAKNCEYLKVSRWNKP
jgi:hypothetical protein